MAAWRTANPLKASYARLKAKANERGIVFTVTWVQFSKFAKDNNFSGVSGNGAQDATIDRIENGKGYEQGNLQLLTRSANAKKRHWYDY